MIEIHPENRRLCYTRVSTYSQTLDAQLEQLRSAGCTNRNTYREKGHRRALPGASFSACSTVSAPATW
jgi:hypothetical protein